MDFGWEMGSLSLFVIGGIAIVIVIYNRIAVLSQRRKTIFADIDVRLDRRNDIIPDMVEIIKTCADHNHQVFRGIIAARTAIKDAYGMSENRFRAEAQMTGAVRQLFVLAEQFPELKADQNYLALHDEVSELEKEISEAFRVLNSTTVEYNAAIRQFPGNLLARTFGFFEEPIF